MSRTKDDTWTGPKLSSRVPMNLSNLPLSVPKEAAIVPAPVSVEIGKMMALLGIAQATRRKGKGGKEEVEVEGTEEGFGAMCWTLRVHAKGWEIKRWALLFEQGIVGLQRDFPSIQSIIGRLLACRYYFILD